ncbi:HalOD1 output domain-containing protein [Natronosalvus vescus]|uniref:HalOD1 output domain-containing protein n=1 Tax=Natronosalvus vescus TaxID=2953881 RepID=UPI0020907B73|nr:HalOD1 output domain-containing protein [Natronosalvus vescus]
MPQIDTRPSAHSMSMRVIEAIAEDSGVDPLDLEVPLFEAVDPEALDQLFRDDVQCTVTFEYVGREITVQHDGTVTVDGSVYPPA